MQINKEICSPVQNMQKGLTAYRHPELYNKEMQEISQIQSLLSSISPNFNASIIQHT